MLEVGFSEKRSLKELKVAIIFSSLGVAGMFNWGIGIAPDVLKSRLQTGEIQFFLDHI